MTELYARRTSDGVSVNESALCEKCRKNSLSLDFSYDAWENAEDVAPEDDPDLYPVDNPDAVCIGSECEDE